MGLHESEVRIIEATNPPPRYARGWHCLGLAEPFRDGKPHSMDVFGSRVVIFQDQAGELHVIDGYCPHMGADLGEGTIEGDTVACPFHGWRWGGDGKCKEIPYCTRVPPKARIKSWPTLEENKQLFIWNDPEGNPPDPKVRIPHIPEVFDGNWSDWIWETVRIDTNARELIDNVSDMAHFYYVHGARAKSFKNTFDGHTARQIMTGKPRASADGSNMAEFGGMKVEIDELYSDACYYGPSYMIDYLKSLVSGMEVQAYLINCHVPIDHNSFHLHVGLMVKKIDGLPQEANDQIAQLYAKGNRDGFFQDVHIWKHKRRIDNPLLCEGDGPIYQLRRWYEQFYVDVKDIQPDMVDRFEVVMDLTKANQLWDATEEKEPADA